MIIEDTLIERPEMYFTPNGKAITTLRLEGGMRCVAWEELAEQISEHIREGDKVKLWGYEKERWWTNLDGEKRSRKEFTVNRIKVTARLEVRQDCCYYCCSFDGGECLKDSKVCFNALGGPKYMEVCKVVDNRCTGEQISNKDCFGIRV